jgi:hypothetical protein
MIKFRRDNFQHIKKDVGGLYEETLVLKFKKIALYKASFKVNEHMITFYIVSYENIQS